MTEFCMLLLFMFLVSSLSFFSSLFFLFVRHSCLNTVTEEGGRVQCKVLSLCMHTSVFPLFSATFLLSLFLRHYIKAKTVFLTEPVKHCQELRYQRLENGKRDQEFLSFLLLPFLSPQSCVGIPLFSNIIMYMERMFVCLGDDSIGSLPEISYLLSVLEREVQT